MEMWKHQVFVASLKDKMGVNSKNHVPSNSHFHEHLFFFCFVVVVVFFTIDEK